MILSFRQIKADKTIKLDPSEEWLEELIKNLPEQAGPVSSRKLVAGTVEAEPIDENNEAVVRVRITFECLPVCGHCLESFTHRIDVDEEFRFSNEDDPSLSQKEVNLRPEDFDRLYLDNGQLHLADFVNEIIILGLPSHAVHSDPESICYKERQLSDSGPVYSDGEAEASNPFAVLGKLKN